MKTYRIRVVNSDPKVVKEYIFKGKNYIEAHTQLQQVEGEYPQIMIVSIMS